jgi:hypothetical protein
MGVQAFPKLGTGVFWINIFEKMLNCYIKVIHYNMVSNPTIPISVYFEKF